MAADEARQKATRKTNAVDSTGQTVAANIARIRNARGLSTYKLAERLAGDAQRPIAASAITRIEAGDRKVDVDDLMAFAIALRVSPSALLLEPTAAGYQEVTGAGIVRSEIAWQWLYGERPLEQDLPADDDGAVWADFQTYSRPPGRRNYAGPTSDADSGEMVILEPAHAAPPRSQAHRLRGVGGHPRAHTLKPDQAGDGS